MAEYEKSKVSKQHILNTARRLFWEKGYIATRFDDFTAEGGINRGLIHYYFKSKETLGWMVYRQIIQETYQLTTELLDGEDDPALHFVLGTKLCWKWIDTSPEYARFVHEAALNRILMQAAEEDIIYNLSELTKQFVDKRRMIIFNRLCIAVENELILSLTENLADITAEECAVMDIQNVFHILDLGQDVLDASWTRADDILSKYSFSVESPFNLICTKNS